MQATRAAITVATAILLVGCGPALSPRTAVDVPVPPPKRPVAELVAELSSEDSEARVQAAWSLAGETELPQEARDVLERLRSDGNQRVRYAAEWAVMHLGGKDTIPEESGTTPPRLVKNVKPDYPRQAHRDRIQGTVLVELLIGEEGEVVHVEIRKSIPELDAAAIASVVQWRFEPGRRNGVPRATVAHAPVSFRIF